MKARPPAPVRAESGLPQGSPAGVGVSLDDAQSGYRTYDKPEDDVGTSTPAPGGSIYRVDGPRSLAKPQEGDDSIDQSYSGPSYMGLGEPHNSPKTKYPYRNDTPNAHNAAYVAEAWVLNQVPDALLAPNAKFAADASTILQDLNPEVKQRSQKCVTSLKRADINNLRWVFSVNCGNGPKVVRVKAEPSDVESKFQDLNLHVACSCPAWRWLGPEFHSTTKDYQDPKTPLQGTASAPNIRDPERINKVCKHVAAMLSFTRAWVIPASKK